MTAQPQFDGATYDTQLDLYRLKSSLDRVKLLMSDGRWRTLKEIWLKVGGSEAGVSARLRDLRKPKFGGLNIERRRRQGLEQHGVFEYRMGDR